MEKRLGKTRPYNKNDHHAKISHLVRFAVVKRGIVILTIGRILIIAVQENEYHVRRIDILVIQTIVDCHVAV